MSLLAKAPASVTLSYGRARPRRRRWWVLVVLAALFAGALFWYGAEVRAFLSYRVAVWQLYAAQQACIDDSAVPGEVVLRTDGKLTELQSSTTRPVRRDELSPHKPVLRRPASADAYETAIAPFLGIGRSRQGDHDGLVACVPVTHRAGTPALMWVRVSATHSIDLRCYLTTPATRTRPVPASPPIAQGYARVSYSRVLGPVVARRVASPENEVHLSFEQGQARTLVRIFWDGQVLQIESDARDHESRYDIRLPANPVPFIPLSPTRTYKLPTVWERLHGMAALEQGVLIVSEPYVRGKISNWQVHRFDLRDQSLSLLTGPAGIPRGSKLAADGSRASCVWQEWSAEGEPAVFGAMTIELTSESKRQLFRHVVKCDELYQAQLTDDGKAMTFAGLRTPLFRMRDDGSLQIIPSERNTFVSQNGRYVVRVGTPVGGAVHLYDTVEGSWSLPIDAPHEAERAFVSHDGRLLFTSGGWWGSSCVLDAHTGNVVTPLMVRQQNRHETACFTRDGQWVAAANGPVQLVNLNDPSRRYELSTPYGEPQIAFASDDRALLVLSGSVLQVVQLDALPEASRSHLPRE